MLNDHTDKVNNQDYVAPQYQRALFPVKIVNFYPNPTDSSDLTLIGSGENGKDYAIKTVDDGNGYVAASELFCYELASRLKIPTPDYNIVFDKNGNLAFGSVWEGGVVLLSENNNLAKIMRDKIQVQGLVNFFSRVFAFDLFVNNIDRHFGNFLVRNSFNSHIILAYDFSRACFETGLSGVDCLDEASNTMRSNKIIKRAKKYNSLEALSIFELLKNMKREQVATIFTAMPDEWLQKGERAGFLKWWGSPEFKTRLNQLSKEL